MIQIYRYKNNFEKEDLSDLKVIRQEIEDYRKKTQEYSYDEIISVWSEFGSKILREKQLMDIEGLLFLGKWLQKENLMDFLIKNLRIKDLEHPLVKINNGFMKPYPRGIICQWTAGNTQTLPIYAILNASITKNSTIVRVSKRNLENVLKILKVFLYLKERPKSKLVNDLLNNIIIIYFPHEEIKSHREMSFLADCKVIWGSTEAIDSIKNLDEKDNCETIIFGPKYSFGVVDSEMQENKNFPDLLKKLALDIILFDQMACSSPQVIFFEESKIQLKQIGESLAVELEKVSKKYPKKFLSEDIAARLINKRHEYLLNPELEIIFSKYNDWTILLGGELKLEKAIQSRTIFIKSVKSLEMLDELINHKIQTIGLSVKNEQKKFKLADKYNYKGCVRCVNQGNMNNYGYPWDGLLVLDRLVRWCFIED